MKKLFLDIKNLKLNFMIFLNIILILTFFFFTLTIGANAVIGEPNATVQTLLEVGNVYPEILNVSIEDGAADFTLTANSTTELNCILRVRDYNGDNDIGNATAVFFDTTLSTLESADDNNSHYTNSSCFKNSNGAWLGHSDDAYTSLFNCTFQVEYYANPGNWNCSVTVNDTYGLNGVGENNDSITVNQLLALSVPDTINYGTVNATLVSNENQTNVTNVGNVKLNLSLEGYAQSQGDGLAMNCSLGSNGTIAIQYERFNLTSSTAGTLNLTQFNGNYTQLTTNPVVRNLSLNYRQNDAINDAINSTYWRIYVPLGVAGNCTGNLIFGATTAAGI